MTSFSSKRRGNKTSLIVSIAVVALVVGLFFLPEVLNFRGAVTEIAVNELKESAIEKGQEALDELDGFKRAALKVQLKDTEFGSEFDDDFFNAEEPSSETSEVELEEESAEEPYVEVSDTDSEEKDSEELELDEEELRSDEALDPKEEARKVVAEEGISWEVIQREEIQAELTKARDTAVTLVANLDSKHSRSIFHLHNFIDGSNRLLEGNTADYMQAEQAALYIEGLDKAVTDAFSKDKIERETYLSWEAVALNGLFGHERAEGYKKALRPSFAPRLSLEALEISETRDKGRRVRGMSPTAVLKAHLYGDDVAHVHLYRDQEFIEEVSIGASDKEGKRSLTFSSPKVPADGLLTLVVYDRLGEVYSKTYSFYPRVRQFRWNQGRYELPFGKGDPRLDPYFAVRTYESSDYELQFGIPDGVAF